MSEQGLRTAAWYGDRALQLHFPEGSEVAILWPDTPPPLTDEEIAAALEQPVGRPPLRELARGASRPLVIVDDLTRPTPAGRVLPHLLRHLHDAGIPPEAVTILLASGAHSRIPNDAVAKKAGPEAASACRLLVHDSAAQSVRVGRTSFGTEVFVNPEVVASDLVVGVGGVYPQVSTGFGGGSKLALGVLATRSIVRLHYRHVTVGRTSGTENEFRLDLDEVARLIGLRTTVNLHVDAAREPVRVVCGDHERYYGDAVAFAREAYRAPFPGDADVVVANAYPVDTSLTFMRSKGMTPLLHAAPEASRIVVAPCPEGVGLHRVFPFVSGPRLAKPIRATSPAWWSTTRGSQRRRRPSGFGV